MAGRMILWSLPMWSVESSTEYISLDVAKPVFHPFSPALNNNPYLVYDQVLCILQKLGQK